MASKGDINKHKVQPLYPSRWLLVSYDQILQKTKIDVKLKSKDLNSVGHYPVIDQGAKLISGYIDDTTLLYNGDLPVIVFGDHTKNIKYVDFEFAIGADGTKILKPKKGVSERFLYYNLQSLRLPDFGYSRHFSVFKALDFPIPPLPEQERIVAKLDKLFTQHAKIKKALDRIPQLLQAFRQQVLTQAVTGKLLKPRKTGQFEDYSISIITGPFGSALHKSDYVDNGIPVINPSHIKNGRIDIDPKVSIDMAKFESLKSWQLLKDDVILGRRGEMGRAAPVEGSNSMLCGTGSVILRSNKIDPKFLTLYLRSDFCVNFLTNNSVGSTMVNLNQKILKSLPIPLYSIQQQQEIVHRVESLFAKVDAIESRYQMLKKRIEALSQAILHKAFKGELVAQLPTDGDVKDLLAEIMALKTESKSKRGKL